MTILRFPATGMTRSREAAPAQAQSAVPPETAGNPEVIVFPRMSMRELRRIWGVPVDGPIEIGPDGRALLRPELRNA